MDWKALRALDEQYMMHTYHRFPVDLDHGIGATLYDKAGRAYIDFTSGMGVNCLGHGNERWAEAIMDQALRLGHGSNLYYTQPAARLAEQLCLRSGMSAAFFANSGAEANEAMIKLARKYSYDRYGPGRSTILTLKNSYHGETVTTLAATAHPQYHQHFFPFTDGFRYTEADIEDMKEQAGSDVCAVMVELIQGEGGVAPLSKQLVHALAILCAEHDWLLLVDEVQTGIGRTGTLFSYQQYGILPDVVSFAGGIAGGLPMGGILANNRCREVLDPCSHGSTFGGNPVCAAAALAVLDTLNEDALAKIREKGAYLRSGIEALSCTSLGDTHGEGLMLGIDLRGGHTSSQVVDLLFDHGLLCLTAGARLRLLPPLLITQQEMDQGLAIMKEILE